MCDVPVVYATTHGHTRRIAQRIVEVLRTEGHTSHAIELPSPVARSYDWEHADGLVLIASLHAGRHQAAADAFARRHVARLNGRPSWFVSVSLAAASARAEERQTAERLARSFAADIGWLPQRLSCVAGCLAYTRYSFLTRWMMRRIARKEGGPTDTSRDHELTDWSSLEALARQFSRDVSIRAGAPVTHAADVA